jgi:hypothetical protein
MRFFFFSPIKDISERKNENNEKREKAKNATTATSTALFFPSPSSLLCLSAAKRVSCCLRASKVVFPHQQKYPPCPQTLSIHPKN